MAGTMQRYPLTLTIPQIRWLEAQADRLGISSAELARRIIDQHREWHDKKIGAFDAGYPLPQEPGGEI